MSTTVATTTTSTTPPVITVEDFTEVNKTTGEGVFDVMMRAIKEHMVDEYNKGRIKGVEYSTVYLGALQSTMDQALALLMGKDKLTYELALLEIQKDKAIAEKALIDAQVLKAQAEVILANMEKDRVAQDILRLEAQTRLLDRQEKNAEKEGLVLDAQVCKLKAEFDLIMAQIPKVESETALLTQKLATERAQTNGAGVDPDSVIGRQIALYGAQSAGFKRDAEQKAASLMVSTWNTRRSTDEGTIAGKDNKLSDHYIGEAVEKLLRGVDISEDDLSSAYSRS